MVYPNTNSPLDNQIRTTLSPVIKINVNGISVGAIQKLTINQNREIVVKEEVGTDGVVDSHPKGAAKISLSVDRVVFNGLSLPEAFGRPYINIHAQRLPFDVQVIDLSKSIDLDLKSIIIHTFWSCWFKSFTTTYNSGNFIIIQGGELSCERATTTCNGITAVFGGLDNIQFQKDSIESNTDVFGLQGKLSIIGTEKQKTASDWKII